MPMRFECSHYFRRSSSGTEVIEGCMLAVAPDAPTACPDNCTYFEKRKLVTTGFVYGSLAPKPEADSKSDPLMEGLDAEEVLGALKEHMDTISASVVAEERKSGSAKRGPAKRGSAKRAKKRRRRKP